MRATQLATLSAVWVMACASGVPGDRTFAPDGEGGVAGNPGAGGVNRPSGGPGGAPSPRVGTALPPGTASRDGAGGCNELEVAFRPLEPEVLIVLDRSGSMFDQGYGGSATRWLALEEALLDPNGVIATLADRVRFGVMTYTSNMAEGTCPLLREVAPALDNYGEVASLVREEGERPGFKADTPTGAALQAASQRLPLRPDATDPRHVILVTDGEPDDCVTADPQCGQDLAVQAVQGAFGLGITTSVIGISDDVSAAHLQALANAGRGLPVAAPAMDYTYNCINPGYASLGADYASSAPTDNADIYRPESAQELSQALESLIRGVTDCGFELNGEVDLALADQGTLLLDGQPLRYEDADGWQMRSARVLALRGAACERARQDAQSLIVSFPCEAFEVF